MRKVLECKVLLGGSGCSLAITGMEDEVVRAAVDHAVAVHGEVDTPELQRSARSALTEEGAKGRYGTVMVATLTGSLDDLVRANAEWAAQRRVPGFLCEELLLGDDGRTVVTPVFFESKEAYMRLADDPAQDRWWSEKIAPLLSDVRWIDGTWQEAVSYAAGQSLVSSQGG